MESPRSKDRVRQLQIAVKGTEKQVSVDVRRENDLDGGLGLTTCPTRKSDA